MLGAYSPGISSKPKSKPKSSTPDVPVPKAVVKKARRRVIRQSDAEDKRAAAVVAERDAPDILKELLARLQNLDGVKTSVKAMKDGYHVTTFDEGDLQLIESRTVTESDIANTLSMLGVTAEEIIEVIVEGMTNRSEAEKPVDREEDPYPDALFTSGEPAAPASDHDDVGMFLDPDPGF
jgi:hypothetical protein